MRRRILRILRKEFLQTLREPRMRFFLFVPPIIQLLVFGYAVNLDVEDSRIAWQDGDRTTASRDLRAAFSGSSYFRVTHTPAEETESQKLLDRGDVVAVVSVLPGFERKIHRGETAPVQILVDGTDSNTASVVAAYASQVVGAFSVARLAQRQRDLQMNIVATTGRDSPNAAAIPSLSAGIRVWFNPDLRSRVYFVPGVIVNIITLVTLMLTALAIVREKEIGTMEQLMVTPIRPIELMIGKTVPFAVIGLLQMALVIGVAMLIFRMPIRGNLLILLVCTILYLLTTLGSGLLLSTLSETQQQAMLASFMFFLLAFMLSGFAFPVRNMPIAVQYLSYLNPSRYFMEVVRGLFLKGVGVEVLWPQMLSMLVYGAAVLTLSALRFHKRLD